MEDLPTMQRVLYAVLAAVCWGLGCSAAGAAPPKGELLYYQAMFPAINAFREVRVAVKVDGTASAFVDWGSRKAEETLRLTQEELLDLKALIRKVAHFGQPERDRLRYLHEPDGTLQVSLDRQGKELFRSDRKEVEALHAFVWKCVQQVTVMEELRGGRFSSVLHAVSPPSDTREVLQPYALRKPLEERVRAFRSWGSDTGTALAALAWLTTREEWMRFLSDVKTINHHLFQRMATDWIPDGPEEHVNAYVGMLDQIGCEDPDVSFREWVQKWAMVLRELRHQRQTRRR
jgi:hypothetical protein